MATPENDELEETKESCMEDDLRLWLEENDDDSFKVTLYKYESGKKKAFVGQWEDEAPSKNDIGMKYGSGKYLLMISLPAISLEDKPRIKSYTFRIHEIFDSYLKKDAPAIVPIDPQLQMIQMMQAMMSIITPLMAAMRQPQVDPLSMFQPFMAKQAEMMQDITKTSIQNQLATANELINNRLADDGEDDLDEESEDMNQPNLFESILPLIEQFLPTIIGDKTGMVAKGLLGAVKKAPQFKAIVQDKTSYIRLIEHLDGKYGNAETNRILKMLKLKR